ncbi:hypothetical protein [Acidocella sp.]|uniref:hypothetical protein n=1 Tax=Acidocella sp. TaxID=50710 RepID=UPI002609819D|nr:hypothetical protein [Acidocella sp.]
MCSKPPKSKRRLIINGLASTMILTAIAVAAHAQADTNTLFDGGGGSTQNVPLGGQPPAPPPTPPAEPVQTSTPTYVAPPPDPAPPVVNLPPAPDNG